MRQQSDLPRTKQLLTQIGRVFVDEADTTLVNGVVIGADWEEAQPNRVQAFLDENDWRHPIYTVIFPGRTVLDPPYSLHNGSEIVWQPVGWRGVVRRISPDTNLNEVIEVVALVVIL